MSLRERIILYIDLIVEAYVQSKKYDIYQERLKVPFLVFTETALDRNREFLITIMKSDIGVIHIWNHNSTEHSLGGVTRFSHWASYLSNITGILVRKLNLDLRTGNFSLLNLVTLTSCSLHVLLLHISYQREMRSCYINHSTWNTYCNFHFINKRQCVHIKQIWNLLQS